MGASTRLGVKVEPELRERSHSAALRMACTPHALNKGALMNLLDRVDRGELHCLNDIEPAGLDNIMTSLSGGFGVFAEFYQEVQQQSVLRAAISASHRRTETECLPLLISLARTPSAQGVEDRAMTLINRISTKSRTDPVKELIQSFSLLTQEGVALMCLAEALLRIPDQATRDALIRDKASKGNWRSQVGDTSVFVNAATWGLPLTGKLVAFNSEQTLSTDIGPVIDSQPMTSLFGYISTNRCAKRPIHPTPMPSETALGTFVPPTLIEVEDISQVDREIFGPVLHLARYSRHELDTLLEGINVKGYGLTFGVHTRIDEMSLHCVKVINAGNVYINRSIIGATVGVQPFGGLGLSGTEPKAGGPLYRNSLLASPDSRALPVWAQQQSPWPRQTELTGPTAERNLYQLQPRGRVLCLFETITGFDSMADAIEQTGNHAVVLGESARRYLTPVSEQPKGTEVLPDQQSIEMADIDAILFEGDADRLLRVLQAVRLRPSAMVPVMSLRTEQIKAGDSWPTYRLVQEKSICINTAAAGGNASLMMLA